MFHALNRSPLCRWGVILGIVLILCDVAGFFYVKSYSIQIENNYGIKKNIYNQLISGKELTSVYPASEQLETVRQRLRI